MSIQIKAIVCDFGGVIINWDPRKVFNKYFENNASAIDLFLEEIHFTEWNLSQDKGYPFAQAVIELSKQFPQYEQFIRAYDEEWEESIVGIIPETVDILKKLKGVGCKLYGLTNWSNEKFNIVRDKYDAFSLFDDIIVSGEVKLIKPDPAIFMLLLDKIHQSANECLLVDDSLQNIKTAEDMGFQTHHFISPMLFIQELRLRGISI
jgi:2-haloacid dehalogenase